MGCLSFVVFFFKGGVEVGPFVRGQCLVEGEPKKNAGESGEGGAGWGIYADTEGKKRRVPRIGRAQ